MDKIELQNVLNLHKLWLENKEGGKRADLRYADLWCANLQGADLRYADLRYANLRDANLQGADLRDADLRYANLRDANLQGADLRDANLQGADLRHANLQGVDLLYANLRDVNLSQVKGLILPSEWLTNNFDQTDKGLIVYKAVGNTPNQNDMPDTWVFAPLKYLTEVCHPDRTLNCACGVNFGTLKWIKDNICAPHVIWKCLIEWRYMSDVVVPYNTDGKARCGKLQLLEIVKSEE